MPDNTPTTTQAPRGSLVYRLVGFSLLAIVVLIGLLLGARYAAGLVGGDSWSVTAGQEVEVSIAPGSSASAIYRQLNDAGVVRFGDIRDAAQKAGVEDQLQAGVYTFITDSDPDGVVRQLLVSGTLAPEDTFTVIEGWTIDRILQELGTQTGFARDEYESALATGLVDSPLLPETSDTVGDLTRWEGLLFPAKYNIGESDTPGSILQRMADEMVERLGPVDWARLDELGIDSYEALIIASLIQREAGTDADRPLISSVIHNRLEADMRLQIDATVVYAIGDVNGRVTGEDLKVESPYNTYRIDGLPPTPIGTVQIISVDAAVDPAETDFFFYVLGHEDGTHVFAQTYEQHQANVRAAKEAGVLP